MDERHGNRPLGAEHGVPLAGVRDAGPDVAHPDPALEDRRVGARRDHAAAVDRGADRRDGLVVGDEADQAVRRRPAAELAQRPDPDEVLADAHELAESCLVRVAVLRQVVSVADVAHLEPQRVAGEHPARADPDLEHALPEQRRVGRVAQQLAARLARVARAGEEAVDPEHGLPPEAVPLDLDAEPIERVRALDGDHAPVGGDVRHLREQLEVGGEVRGADGQQVAALQPEREQVVGDVAVLVGDERVLRLAGLEPVGPLPVVSEGNRRNLGRLRSALSSVLNFSFFRTRDMRSDFAGGTFSGTLPILYIFLARSGKTVHEASLIRLDASGEAVGADATPPARGQPTGARIVFSGDDGERRTLYYFSADVSNGGPYHQALLQFCAQQGTGDAFVKSASYLMHSDNFANVRNFLLEHAQLILQDDSGIPVRYFQPADWVLEPHGRYLGPIGLFAGRGQAQLGDLFRRSSPEPLDFGVGYRFRQNESNLLLATRKPTP